MNKGKDADQSRNSAGLAGAGGGTLVAVVANELPDGNFLKVPLIYCAPSISLILTLSWVWLQVRVASYFREREVKNLVENLKVELETKLKERDLPDELRLQFEKELNELKLISVQRLKKRLQSLDVITAKDFSKETKENGEAKGNEE